MTDPFEFYDYDGSDDISAQEIRHVNINLGVKMTDEEAAEIVREADVDGDGILNRDEFVAIKDIALPSFGDLIAGFKSFDAVRGGNGYIYTSELKQLFINLGCPTGVYRLRTYIDLSADEGVILFAEFVNFIGLILTE